MGIISVPGPRYGLSYNINIAGDTPTQDELARINQYIAQQEDSLSQRIGNRIGIGAAPEAANVLEEDPAMALERGFEREPIQRRAAFGTSARAIGQGLGIDWLAEYGTNLEDEATRELQEYEAARPSVGLFDIRGPGGFASFAGEAIGEEARDLAIQTGATVAGGGIGAIFGGIGAAPGAAIGRLAGVGYTTIESIPQVFAEQIRAQEQAGGDISLAKAAAATAANSLAEAIADYFIVGKLLKPASGRAFKRALMGGGQAAGVEGATEVVQEVVTRFQAGLPLDNEEALRAYAENFAAGAVVGGGFGGAAGVLAGDADRIEERKRREAAAKELEEDLQDEATRIQSELEATSQEQIKEEAERVISPLSGIAGEVEEAEESAIALPAPQAKRLTPQERTVAVAQAARETQTPFRPVPIASLPLEERVAISRARASAGIDPGETATLTEIEQVLGPDVVNREAAKQKPTMASASNAPYGPVENKLFNQEQYEAALRRATASGKINFPLVRRAINDVTKAKVPNEVTRAVIDEMIRRGVVRRTKKGALEVEPLVKGSNSPSAIAQKEIDRLAEEADRFKEQRLRLEQDIRRVEQTGKTLAGKPVSVSNLRRQLGQAQAEEQQRRQRLDVLRREIGGMKDLGKIPSSEAIAGDARKLAVDIIDPRVRPEDVAPRMEALQNQVNAYETLIAETKKRLSVARRAATKATGDAKRDAQGLVSSLEAEINAAQEKRERLRARIQDPSALIQTKRAEVAANNARVLATIDARPEQTAQPSYTPAYSQKFFDIFSNLRERLNKMGMKDIALQMQDTIKTPDGSLAEGDYANKIIRLASGIYNKNLSEQELNDRIAAVMDHEVIHALRALGLFTDQEWQSLTKAAGQRKYIAIKNGKPVERNYTYLDRAARMYQSISTDPEIVTEEAVAEMFRDYMSGRNKFVGRPKKLFDRIKDFFRSIFGANEAQGFVEPAQIFADIEAGVVGARERNMPQPEGDEVQRFSLSYRDFKPEFDYAPDGIKAHKLPPQLLIRGTGADPIYKITQSYTAGNAQRNNAAIQAALDAHPDALMSADNWRAAMQDTFGGEYIPAPPLPAIKYASNIDAMVEKLRTLTPELKRGVDEGFQYVEQLRNLYATGQATPKQTLDLFVWGILSRGAGPVQQEGAFIDIIDAASPFIEKAVREPLTQDDIDRWENMVTTAIREGSPGKSVTMNVNAAGRLIAAMSQMAPGSNRTVVDLIHEQMSDPSSRAADIRQSFLSNAFGAGIDNKVLSFILLVGGKDDVLVMDRIQGRHLWDDGRYGGANIYDGIGTQKEGLNGIFRGPRGILVTRMLEDGMRKNVQEAYARVGRPEDASLGRWHWETWVIDGEQAVNHSTLEAVINGTPIGSRVTEGKTDTFSSGMTYIRTENGTVVEYPLSDGSAVYMKPERFTEFTRALANEASKAKPKTQAQIERSTGIFKEGKFKVTERADIPWFDRPEIDRGALDTFAREYENARPDGSVLERAEGTREGQDASVRGQSDLDRRYSAIAARGRGQPGARQAVAGAQATPEQVAPLSELDPLPGAPKVRGFHGPDPNLVRVAKSYAKSIGLDLRRQSEYVEVDPELAKRISAEYEAMKHEPQNPKVKEAFQNLIRQTLAQYRALENDGYKFWFMDMSRPDNQDYASSPWNALRDIRANKEMGVFPTLEGFGSAEGESNLEDNVMLKDTGIRWPIGGPDGEETASVLANDLFRAVHDAFGHGLEGSGFRARGEENAWQAHARLFTGTAVGALTSETRGQNSWLNYGPYGEQNQNASVEDTVFADQKTGLMPEWTWLEGRAGDAQPMVEDEQAPGQERFSILYSPLNATSGTSVNTSMQNQMTRYTDIADYLGKVIGYVPFTDKTQAQKRADKLVQKLQDSFIPIGRVIKELKDAGITITDAIDPYLKQQLSEGIAGGKIEERKETIYRVAAESVKGIKLSDAQVNSLKQASNAAAGQKGLAEYVFDETKSRSLAAADMYLAAKHAKERNAYIRRLDPNNTSGSGITDAEADAILDWFRNNLDAESRNALLRTEAAVREIVADTNRVRADAGLQSEDVGRVDFEGNEFDGPDFQFYVPLRGHFETDEDHEYSGPSRSPLYGAKGREDFRAMGRHTYAKNILGNVMLQNTNAIIRGERNKVGQSLLELIRTEPEAMKAYAQILERRPVMRVLRNGRITTAVDPKYKERDDIVIVKEGGQEQIISFYDENLAGAFNGRNIWSPSNGGTILRGLAKLNRYLSNINTSYNPEFFISNFFRDLQSAGINVSEFEMEGVRKETIGNVFKAAKGLKRAIRDKDMSSEWAKIYDDFVKAGGRSSANPMTTLADQVDDIEKVLSDISDAGGKLGIMKAKGRKLLEFLEDYNLVVENAIRVSTFDALRKRGVSTERAAQAARSVTVDFGKGGDYKGLLNSLYLFYNASLQGSFFMLRALARSKKVQQVTAGVIAAGFLQDLINGMMSEEDEDGVKAYDKIPDWVLEHNWVIMLPGNIAGVERPYIAIPMPYGMNFFFNTGRAMSQALRGATDPMEAAASINRTLLEVINPLGGTEHFLNFAAPTVADPFISLYGTNLNFMGRDIRKEPFPNQIAADSSLYWSSTSPTAVQITGSLNQLTGGTPTLSGWIDWSPDTLQFWYEYLTGGAGRFVQNTIEAPFRVAQAQSPEDIVGEVPFARKVLRSVTSREDIGIYIEGRDKIMRARAEFKDAIDAGDSQRAIRARNKYSEELKRADAVMKVENARRKLIERRNMVLAAQNITDEQRRAYLDTLDEQLSRVILRGIELTRGL